MEYICVRTHMISAILNIKQKVDRPWPLQAPQRVILRKCVRPLHAEVHFFPSKYKSYQFGVRFKRDFSVNYGDPVMPITLEALQKDDQE